MDLTKMSDATLKELSASGGDISKLSNDSLREISGGTPQTTFGQNVKNGALGAVQGATLGFGDEIAGVGNALLDKLPGKSETDGMGFGDAYRHWRDKARGINDQAKFESPKSYFAGNLAGGAAVPMGEFSVGKAIAGGAAAGLGNSESDVSKGGFTNYFNAAKDTGIGAGLGYGIGKLGQALGGVKNAPEALTEAANTNVVKSMNPTPAMVRDIGDGPGMNALGQALRDNGIGGFGKTGKDVAEGAQNAIKGVGQKIGQAYQAADQTPGAALTFLKPEDIEGALTPVAKDLGASAGTIPYADKVRSIIDNFKQAYGQGSIPYGSMKNEVTMAQNAFDQGLATPGTAKAAQQKVSMALRELLNGRLNQNFPESGIEGLNSAYSTLKAAEPAAERAMAGAGQGVSFTAIQTAKNVLSSYGRNALAGVQGGLANSRPVLGAAYLAKKLDNGQITSALELIQQATALGLPPTVINQLKTSMNGSPQ